MATASAEWRRESDLTKFYGLVPAPALARDIFNIVEGQRIEATIRRAYPGIRRDMDLIQEQTLARREETGTSPADLPEVGQVIDALMVSTMAGDPPFDHMAAHVREASEGAIALLVDVEHEGATVADTARITARIYSMIDDVMAAGRRGITDPFSDEAKQQQPSRPDDAEGDQDVGEVEINALDEYEPMELPPFVPPVMEELVQDQSMAENQIEAEGAEGDAEKDGNKGEDAEAESAEAADKVMQAQQVSEGQMEEDGAAQKGESDADMEESGRGSDAEGEDEIDSAGGMTPEVAARLQELARQRGVRMPERTGRGGGGGGNRPSHQPVPRTVYVLAATGGQQHLTAVTVMTGITDGSRTEIVSGLPEGAEVVTTIIAPLAASGPGTNPFGGGRRF